MTLDRWRQIEHVYHAALERDGHKRRDYLDDACRGDDELRGEVESLLAQDASSPEHVFNRSAFPTVNLKRSEITGLQPGARIGPYEIESPLGAGGMGEVWKARDTRLGRPVAIKISKTDFTRRFELEARAVAALNHPHICTLYDVGPNYLVLEYIEGKTLTGPLEPQEAVRLALQITDALQEAHNRGILHRDLKPGNIMVTSKGNAKLLDFGLAKLVAGPDPRIALTLDRIVAGTPAYMSPEQARSESIDNRSDIFSFGVVLYEMLSGRKPFAGDSTAQILCNLLHSEPHPLRASPAIERVVLRCLEKSPDRRYQSIGELQVALAGINFSQPVERPSIAVLPFANMSETSENEYFSDGLAEEIINSLGQIPNLKVIARTSAFSFKGKQEDIRRIGEALGVDHILEGSVRRAGARIRVTAQLIATNDASHLWSHRYDREVVDIFEIQDDISSAITSALRVKLSGVVASNRYIPADLGAYEELLKARHFAFKYTPEAFASCRKHYQEAIRLDSHYPLAHAELGVQTLLSALPGITPAHDAMPKAIAECKRALELDDALPEAHAGLGAAAAVYEYDWTESRRHFDLALSYDPIPPSVRFMYGMFYLAPMGMPNDAVAQQERGLQEDPLSFGGRFQLGVCLHQANRLDEAEIELRKVAALHPTTFQGSMFLALNYAAQNDWKEALAAAEESHRQAPWHSHTIAILAAMLAKNGSDSRAKDLIERLTSLQPYGVPTAMTFYHILIGDLESGATWSAKAIEQRDPRIVLGLQLPMANLFRGHPRGRAIIERMGLNSLPALPRRILS